MIFQQTKFENELKQKLIKAIMDNSHLYSRFVISNIEKGIDGANAYIGAPEQIINQIDELAKMELHTRPDLLERYIQVHNEPNLCGYNFHSSTLTVGVIYLFFVWAFSGKTGKKNNCLEIDSYFSKCLLEERKRIIESQQT